MDSDIKMAAHLNPRAVVFQVCGILFIAVCLPAWSQKSNPHPSQKKVAVKPKCAFLRSEERRIMKEGQEFVDSAPLASVNSLEDLAAANGTVSDWAAYVGATEVFSARRGLVGLEFSACERGVALSDPARLSEIERMRTAHVRRAAQRWQNLAGEQGNELEAGLDAKINAVYEAETKSFYNSVSENFEDRDIGKDYSDLPSLIQNSALDQGTKDFYKGAVSFLRYEEAGRLTNALKGLDKEQGLNY